MHWSSLLLAGRGVRVARGCALPCLVAAICSNGQAGAQTKGAIAQPASVVTYVEDSSNFPNPERGFYRQRTPLWLGTDRSPLASSDLATFRAEGITVLRAYYVIDEFRDAPLSAEMLAALEADFATVRAAGLKV